MMTDLWYPALIGVLSCLLSDGALPMDRFLGFPSWWLPAAIALIVSAVAFPLTKKKTKKNEEDESSSSSSSDYYPLTFATRKKFILQLSIIPIVICFLAFTRSAIYRVIYPIRTVHDDVPCQTYGWYNNASGRTKCDHKALDVHATLALLWLTAFSIQIISLLVFKVKGLQFHKTFGTISFGVALLNVGAMLMLAYDDYMHPMKDSHRPPSFRPMMVTIGISFGICLYLSYCGLVTRQIDVHMIWMYRAFIITFTTPMIRFYPLVLRRIFGTECTWKNLDRLVMASTAISGWSMLVLLALVQRKTQPKVWDGFMKITALCVFLAEVACIRAISGTGSFIVGMAQCGLGLGGVSE